MTVRAIHLFTLHKSEDDLAIVAAVLAENPKDAASLWGGAYRPPEDTTSKHGGVYRKFEDHVCAASSDRNSLSLCGSVEFHPALFRSYTSIECGNIGYNPGRVYDKVPGLVLHKDLNSMESIRLIMRRNHIYIHSSVQFLFRLTA